MGPAVRRVVPPAKPPKRPCVGGQQLRHAENPHSQALCGGACLGNDVPPCALPAARGAPKVIVKGDYYRENILVKACLDAIHRVAEIDGFPNHPLMTDTSRALFIQDGAPTHTVHNSGVASPCPTSGSVAYGPVTAPTSIRSNTSRPSFSKRPTR